MAGPWSDPTSITLTPPLYSTPVTVDTLLGVTLRVWSLPDTVDTDLGPADPVRLPWSAPSSVATLGSVVEPWSTPSVVVTNPAVPGSEVWYAPTSFGWVPMELTAL